MSTTREFERQSGTASRPFIRAREGSVATLTALSATFMIGAVALAVDLGAAYNLSTTLDNAADAYAIAGATQLDNSAGSCVRAIRAAAATANAGLHAGALRNLETLATDQSGIVTIDPTETLANRNIQFLTLIRKDADGNVVGDYITADLATCDSDAAFIEVTVDSDASNNRYRIGFALAPILGVTEAFPSGYAVAGIGAAFCGAAPMMMCELQPLPAPATDFWDDLVDDPDLFRGRGLWLRAGEQHNQWGSGNFGFLQVEGACGGGANCLEQAFAVNAPIVCLGLEGLETETGAKSGARDGFNSMFDIYPNGGGPNAIGSSDPQWQPAVNTVKGELLAGNGNNCSENDWVDPFTLYEGPETFPLFPPPEAMPYPMDNCAYSVANGGTGTCMATGANDRMGTDPLAPDYWDIDNYLDINQDGMTEAALRADLNLNAPNPPGPGPITRLNVYEWEMGHPGMNWGSLGPDTTYLVDYDQVAGPTTLPLPDPLGLGPDIADDPQLAEYGGPQCYDGPMGNVAGTTLLSDRRVIEIAVVDCVANVIQGNTPDVTAEGFVEVLVLTPWTVQGGQHDMYVEIIGPVQSNGIARSVAKNIVHLYE